MGFGYLIREARERRGWSQIELAERLDVGRGYVGQLETDRITRPRPAILARIEQVLGVSREEIARAAGLIGPAAPPDIAAELRRIRSLPTERDRVTALQQLPPDVLFALEELAVEAFRRGLHSGPE